MIRQLVLTAALACLFSLTPAIAQTPATPSTPGLSQASWFTEGGASTGNNLLGGLGVAMPVAGNQEIFGEFALQSGSSIHQATTLEIGVKSNLPSFTLKAHKITPFGIVAYGAAIETLLKQKITTPASPGLNAATITAIGTGAGFAQQYAAGFQTNVGAWTVGLGFSGDKISSAWRGYPFVFLSHSFGKAPAPPAPAKVGP